MPQPARIAITGASSGLGEALARRIAAPGVTLLLCARDITRFGPIVPALRAAGAEVEIASVDVADTQAIMAWITALDSQAPIDLLILNAGQFGGRDRDGALETPERAAALIATNLTGTIAPALVAGEFMRQRKNGHIVFISSLAAFGPQQDAASYGASKAGVTAFARALREDLAPANVRVTLVHPGHIETAQTDQHVGALPGLISADRAAQIILDGIARRRAEIDFPIHLRILLALLSALPWRLRARILAPYRFRVKENPHAPK